jgi:DNA-binding NarL/FixJ family response regulator
MVHKGATGLVLAEAIRTVARGRSAMPDIARELLTAAVEAIGPEDHAILGMLVHGLPQAEICRTLRIEPAELHARRARMLAALRVPAAG